MKSPYLKIGLGCLLTALAVGCQGAASPAAITADNAAGLVVVQQILLSAPYDLAWSPDGSALLVLEGDGAVRLEAATLRKAETLVFKMPILMANASPDGETLAYSEDGSSIALVNIRKPEAAVTIFPNQMIGGLDFSPDGQILLANSLEEFAVLLWDASSGMESGRLTGFETAAPVYSARFGDDGKHILWIARGTVQAQQIASGEMGAVISHEDFITSVRLSPDGRVLAVASAGTVRGEFSPALFLWDAPSGEALGILPDSEPFGPVAFSPDGRLIASANSGRITIWDAAEPRLVADLEAGTEIIRALAFSPDGAALASVAGDGTLALWRVK